MEKGRQRLRLLISTNCLFSFFGKMDRVDSNGMVLLVYIFCLEVWRRISRYMSSDTLSVDLWRCSDSCTRLRGRDSTFK